MVASAKKQSQPNVSGVRRLKVSVLMNIKAVSVDSGSNKMMNDL